MTKEELKQEAEVFLKTNLRVDDDEFAFFKETNDCKKEIERLTGFAEPREKRIAELEATNKKISDECHKLVDSLEKKQKEIAELEKENAELKAEIENDRDLPTIAYMQGAERLQN